ncbi:hypothetical protein RSOLAG1IB_08328 [Rhizoctonia solani AG-1 IB]|uniref:Uncharacterized protein n=1 Tax=Thanatephorus cucumeris (strain AG1-IB / isolate 7/3/14) TaxID=1108050 RepID=A0A0B7FJM6_THACB|nr:hypothetical protein RSOLAG1IB_08328 [Rhizoctonia solani AG-1 IB]
MRNEEDMPDEGAVYSPSAAHVNSRDCPPSFQLPHPNLIDRVIIYAINITECRGGIRVATWIYVGKL